MNALIIPERYASHRHHPRRADGHGAAGHRHVPAGAADDCTRPGRQLRGGSGEPGDRISSALPSARLFYGPLSDRFGRKPALSFGLTVFVASSVGCALAWNVESLIGFRFLQALGGCAPLVIPRAVVRDLLRRTRVCPDVVDADSGDGPGADSGAARRRSAARELRLALRVLGADRVRRDLVCRRRRCFFPRAFRPSRGDGSRSARSLRSTASCSAIARTWDTC